VWPLAFVGVAALAARRAAVLNRDRSAQFVAVLAGVGGVASMAWASILGTGLVGGAADPNSRAYFGTDTRVGAMLIGACLGAFLMMPGSSMRGRISAAPRWVIDVATLTVSVPPTGLVGADGRLFTTFVEGRGWRPRRCWGSRRSC
jgi:peptidoglycan/LPS O-acetylase OafA/YrhL